MYTSHYCACLFFDTISVVIYSLIVYGSVEIFQVKSHDGGLPNLTWPLSMYPYSITGHPMCKSRANCKVQAHSVVIVQQKGNIIKHE